MSEPKPPHPLYKHNSWSPDSHREEAWIKRRSNHRVRLGRSKSVTHEDLDELKACFELGFGFDSPEMDPKLSNVIPALEFYRTVNRQYNCRLLSRSSSSSSTMSLDYDTTSLVGSPPTSIFEPGDDPKTVKTKLKQWAQVVACSVRQSSPN